MIRALLALGHVFFFVVVGSTAFSQDSVRRLSLVLTDVQVVGVTPKYRGFQAVDLNPLLMFALSANQDLEVSASPSNISQGGAAQDVARLTSIIQAADETTFWTGDLLRPDGKSLVRLGPVILNDAKGSRAEAPRQIADLVVRSLRDASASTALVAVRLGCFKAEGIDSSLVVAELRAGLAASFERDKLVVRAPVVSPDCEFDTSGRRDEVVITARVINSEQTGDFVVTPRLSGARDKTAVPYQTVVHYQDAPLPMFRGKTPDFLQSRRQYIDLLARAVQSNIACSGQVVMDGAQAPASEQVAVARRILESKKCPYLAAALMESSEVSDAGVQIDIARAYRQANEAAQALRTLTRADIREPDESRAVAQYEIARASLDLQLYPQAMEGFRAALAIRDFPDAHYRYAQAAYLTDDRGIAWKQLTLALEVNSNDPAVRMLAARLALDQSARTDVADTCAQCIAQAFDHAKVAFDLSNDKSAVRKLVKDIGSKAAAVRPRTAVNLRTAEQAYNLLLAGDEDNAEMILARGRVRLMLAQLAQYENGKIQNAEALDDLKHAAELAKQQPTSSPQLQVVDLEVAEAYLLNAQFAQAQTLAGRFLAEQRDPEAPVSTYQPVAYLLKFAGEALAARAEDRSGVEELLRQVKQYNQWPEISIMLTSNSQKKIAIPVTRWNFTAMDEYVCQLTDNPARNSVLQASRSIQAQLKPAKLDATNNAATCDALPPG
jgi:tetratricopeptide (TPR) repeat protein